MSRAGNLLRDLPDARAAEITDALFAAPGLRIERIVSFGQASPPGFWYDQPETEWVLLLEGAARLRFADEPDEHVLGPGDWLHITAHRRHRVEWTDPAQPTVWLAVFYGWGIQEHAKSQNLASAPVISASCRTRVM